ncbi:hypothetical protein Lser_V15G00873 [Lactuca serriola]
MSLDKAVLCSCKNVTNDSTQSTDPSHESGPEVHVSEAEDEDLQLDPIFSVPPSQFEGAAACDINDKLSSLDPLQSETSDDDIDINDVYSSPAPLQVEETYYAPFQVEETDDDVLMSKRDFKILNRKLKLLLEFSESISQPPPSTQFQMSEQFYTELKSKIDNQEKMIKDEIDRLVSEWSKKFAAQDTTIKSLVDGISSIQEKSKDFGKSIDTLVEEIRETKVVYSSDMQKKLVDTKEREACSKNFLDDALGHLKFLEPNVQGLNQKWGEWVGVECLMKHNKENVEKMKATSEKQHPLENSTKDALHLKDPNVTRGKKRKSMSKEQGYPANPNYRLPSLAIQWPPLLLLSPQKKRQFVTHTNLAVIVASSATVNEFATSTEVGEGTTSLQADHAVTPGVGVGESMAMNETSGSKAKLSALPQTELLKAFRCMAVESLLLMAEAAKRLESFEAKEIELKGELLGCKATVASQA